MPFIPFTAQVAPGRIHDYHQSDFLDPQESLDLLLTGDGASDVIEAFEVNQPIQLVLRGKG
jgi:hypothetical protein